MKPETYQEIPPEGEEQESKENFREIQAATVQMECEPGQVENNLEKAEKFIEQAAREGTQVIVLPELFNTGYIWNRKIRNQAEEIEKGGITLDWLKKKSQEYNVTLVGTIVEKENNRFYNATLVVQGGEIKGQYRKTFPFYPEKLAFSSGKKPGVVEIEGVGKIGLATCWDVMHRKSILNYFDRQKVDLIIINSAWPEFNFMNQVGGKFKSFDEAVQNVSQYWAKELGVPVIISMQAGEFDSQMGKISTRSKFVAKSRIINRKGRVQEKVTSGQEGMVTAKVEIKE